MGISQLCIDFRRCISNRIAIKGSNGSGKSTLLSALNLYPESNEFFIPGVEARKTLNLITRNGIRYSIRYIHPATSTSRGTTKAYITEILPNGLSTELNPNGNVSSCKEIIDDKFNIDSGMSSLAQLTSENRGLVDKRPAERKRMFNSIAASLEVYNNIYKTVSKKAVTYRGLIQSLTSKIDVIGNEGKLSVMLDGINKQILILEADKEQATEAMAGVKLKIVELESYLSTNKYDDISKELMSITQSNKSTMEYIMSTLTEYGIVSPDRLKAFSTHLGEQIISLESQIGSIEGRIPSMLSERETEYSRLQDKQHQLETYQIDKSYDNAEETMKQYKAQEQIYINLFNQMGLDINNLLTKDEFVSAMESIHYMKNLAYSIMNKYPLGDVRFYVSSRGEAVRLITSIQNINGQLASLHNQKDSLVERLSLFKAKREIASELSNRPLDCKIDTCIYIAAALEADRAYPESTYTQLQMQYDGIVNEIATLEAELERAQIMAAIENDVKIIERELASNMKFIRKLPLRRDFEITFLERMLEFDPFDDITNLYKYVDCSNALEEYTNIQNQIKVFESEYKIYLSRADILNSIILDINHLNDKLNELSANIESIQAEIAEKKKQLDNLKSAKEKIDLLVLKYENEYLVGIQRQKELEEVKSKLDESMMELQRAKQNLGQVMTNLTSINNDIRNLLEQRERCSHSLTMLAEYKAELEKYKQEAFMVDKIRYYSSSTTGISNVYINLYLQKILYTANELLAMFLGGRFKLLPFVVNEQEFRIPCISESGVPHDDLSSCSTGEKSLISMIISFALMAQSNTTYRIVTLDEIDGVLDSMNRAAFVTLLDTIMQKLNIDQLFMVSHNNEIDFSSIDVILLRSDNVEYVDGNIIWKY